MKDDLIKRSDAIEAITYSHLDNLTREERIAHINALPPADRPQGEWINKHEWANGFYERECSICGAMKPILMHTAKVNFCPNCGCRMKGADDE